MEGKRCLIIANGEACSLGLTRGLLADKPFVIALDGSLLRVLEQLIHVDVLLGDFDRFDINEAKELLPNSEVIYAPDQEKTDLDKGIELAIARGYKNIDIIWATGWRADHTITNITNMVRYASQAHLTMYDDYSVIYPIGKGFRKFYTSGTIISLIPVGTVKGIITSNLKFPLVHEDLVLGHRAGTSNEAVKDGFVEITYTYGQMLIMECKDKE
jgi:thiamine pyrophosphokinase